MRRLIVAAALTLAMSGEAMAQAKPAAAESVPDFARVVVPHWYAGAAVGQTILDLADDALPAPGSTASTLNKGQNKAGYKLFGGYRLHRNFALEGAYADYGEFIAIRQVTAPTNGELSARIRVRALLGDAVATLPFNNGFSVFGKLGAAYWRTTTQYTTTGTYSLPAGTDHFPRSHGVSWKYGVGGAYAFTERVSLRLEYEVVKRVGEASTVEGDMKALFCGLQYRF
jgi:OOP family OmpA-OmpF porin